MKKLEKLTNIIESVLLVSGNPIEINDFCEKLNVTQNEIENCIIKLKEKYNEESGIQLLRFNKKLQFASNPTYASQVEAILNPIREKELSRSLLEVSAIIAYKQPITRTEIEEIRGGVSCDYAMSKLLELKVIDAVGRKDTVGKPIVYGTTDEFLKRFQISSLDDLPDYETLLDRIAKLRPNRTQDLYNSNRDLSESAQPEIEQTNVKEIVEQIEENKVDDIDDILNNIDEEELPDFLQGEEDIITLS